MSGGSLAANSSDDKNRKASVLKSDDTKAIEEDNLENVEGDSDDSESSNEDTLND